MASMHGSCARGIPYAYLLLVDSLHMTTIAVMSDVVDIKLSSFVYTRQHELLTRVMAFATWYTK